MSLLSPFSQRRSDGGIENGGIECWPRAGSLIEVLFVSTGDLTTCTERSDIPDSTPKATHTGTATLQDISHFLLLFYLLCMPS